MDPLQALQQAYAVPPNSKEQADLLSSLRDRLETTPTFIPILCSSLVRAVAGAADSLLKSWTLDLLHFGLSKANLPIEKRTELATSSLDNLAQLLNDPSPLTVKTVVQCFSSVYPLIFRYLCMNRSLRPMWETLVASKAKIFDMVWQPTAGAGLKLAALKFMQRVILVQTRGAPDPRLQKPNDPNLSFCPPDHPFIPVAALEAEGTKLIEGVVTLFYTSPNPDIMSAIVNSWSVLAKQRPAHSTLIINALCSWHPGSIAHLPASTVRSVEKAVRLLLIHLSKTPPPGLSPQLISDALAQQAARMEQAAMNERNRKAAAEAEANRKRASATNDAADSKRQKTEHQAGLAAILENFDFSVLPVSLITDIIISNMQSLTEDQLAAAILAYRQANGMIPAPPAPVASTSKVEPPARSSAPIPAPTPAPTKVSEPEVVKAEPQDPLQMDIDDEDIDFEPEKPAVQPIDEFPPDLPEGVELFDVEENLHLVDIKLPPPKVVSDDERGALVKSSMKRIWGSHQDFMTFTDPALSVAGGCSPQDLWMLLLVRMITRSGLNDSSSEDSGAREESKEIVTNDMRHDKYRQILFDYVMQDFQTRVRLALIWMNEEWYNVSRRRETEPNAFNYYDIWLQKIVNVYENLIDAKDKTLSRFLLDVPHIPIEILDTLREICTESDRMPVGFSTLREFVATRIPLRFHAMKNLLDLTTHPEKVTRGAAIITVKRWMPDIQPMADMVRTFALRLVRRLQLPQDAVSTEKDPDLMEDGEMPRDEEVQTEYLPAKIELPADNNVVLQHVELLFSLSAKSPEFLGDIFDAYGQMDESVQQSIQELITALIRSLGSSHPQLLTILRSFPAGAETLALRILHIFTENTRPSATLVTLVKELIAQRDLDARFLIPIIAEMDKPDIIRHLPKVVSMLDGTVSAKQLVRSVFESIVTTPPQTFGSVSSNLPRVRQSELLSPAELMVLLHESEKEIGLKSAIEAIGICFSMTDVYRSEILAVVMNQLVDEPTLPVLFLRTVIQAVSTYKSLVNFVSRTLLSRLITKKIWTNAPLWEGFMRCAKVIGPASFGALLQLPKEQLRELVDKQPSLKAGLRDYVLKKDGNKARQAGFLDIFGDTDGEGENPEQSPVLQQAQAITASTA